MATRIILIAVLFASVGSSIAWAHPDHHHPAPAPEITADQAAIRAREAIPRLIAQKKLDASWKEATVKGTEKKTYDKHWEWLTTFVNAKVQGKVLHVFLSPAGRFLAANFTGK